MGYTHYYYMPKEVVDAHWERTKQKEFGEGIPEATLIINEFRERYDNYHRVFKHSRAKIETLELETDAMGRYCYIHFNGIGDSAHESFTFPPKQNGYEKDEDKYYFEFTKTAYKPYDQCVTAFLLIAKHYLGDNIVLKSDGNIEDWIKGSAMSDSYTNRSLIRTLQTDFDREVEE